MQNKTATSLVFLFLLSGMSLSAMDKKKCKNPNTLTIPFKKTTITVTIDKKEPNIITINNKTTISRWTEEHLINHNNVNYFHIRCGSLSSCKVWYIPNKDIYKGESREPDSYYVETLKNNKAKKLYLYCNGIFAEVAYKRQK